MIETELDRRPATSSVALAGVLVGVFAVAMAVTVGAVAVLLTLTALGGAVALVSGWSVIAEDPESASHQQLAVASVGITLGSLGLFAPLIWLSFTDAVLVLPFVWAVIFVGLNGLGCIKSGPMRWLSRLCWRSRDMVVVFAVAVIALETGALWTVLEAGVYTAVAVVGTSSTGALFVLLAECYLLLYFLPRAQTMLEERAGLSTGKGLDGIAVRGSPLDELLQSVRQTINEAWRVLLGISAFLLLFQTFLDSALLAIPVVGPSVQFVLRSGLFHWLVGVILLVALIVVCIGNLHALVEANRSVDFPEALATGTGGVAIGLLALPTVLLPSSVGTAVVPSTLKNIVAALGPGGVVLSGTALLLLALPILLIGIPVAVSGLSLTADRTSGFVTASLLVLIGTVIGAVQGVFVLLVFVGVAVAVLVWDLGEQASYLGVHLGRETDTRGPELVHAFGSIAVGLVGIVLAALVAYLVGPIELPRGSGRAYVALAFALVAALGFSLSLSRS